MLLKILEYPDPRLRTIAKPVPEITDDMGRLVDNMLETMYDASGIGLAAPQVGVPEQIIVLDLSGDRSDPRVFINPQAEVVDSGITSMKEGCLSLPGAYEEVSRNDRCRVRALDRTGEPFEILAEGLLSVCIQHEMDHLNGRLFIDHLSNVKKNRVRKQFKKRRNTQS